MFNVVASATSYKLQHTHTHTLTQCRAYVQCIYLIFFLFCYCALCLLCLCAFFSYRECAILQMLLQNHAIIRGTLARRRLLDVVVVFSPQFSFSFRFDCLQFSYSSVLLLLLLFFHRSSDWRNKNNNQRR